MDRAFRLQSAVTAELGWSNAGWKIGCTSRARPEGAECRRPFSRHACSPTACSTPGSHVPTIAGNKRVVEPEVAFTMAKRPAAARYSPMRVDEVLSAVAAVHPAIEVVNPRTPKGFGDAVPWFVVDGGLNDAHRAG